MYKVVRFTARVLAAFALAGATHAAEVKTLSGAGATFPYPIYAKWAAAYSKTTGIQVNYQSIGSGGGIKQIQARTVDFGASDKPLSPAELDKAGLIQFPMVMGGVVPVVNLPGVAAGRLRLSGALLGDIYLGKVKQWNDKAIAALNPGVALPGQEIVVVHRSDGSGTTWIFTNYLSRVNDQWKSSVGNDASVSWPTGIGGKGNEGVAAYVTRTKGAIGYVEYAYALQNKMAHIQLKNASGNFVSPDSKSFQAAAANADWAQAPSFYMVLTEQPGEESWPITGASFILAHRNPTNVDTAKAVLSFFSWAYRSGDELANDLHYIPMPDNVVNLVEASWADSVRGPQNQAIWSVARRPAEQKPR